MKWTLLLPVIGLCIIATGCTRKNSLNEVSAVVTMDGQKAGIKKDNFTLVITPQVEGMTDTGERIIFLTGHCIITEGHKIDSIAFYEGNNIIDANHYLVTEAVNEGTATHTVLAYKQPGTYWLTAVAIDKHGIIIKMHSDWYIIV